MPIDLFGTFLDKLSTVIESPDHGGSSGGSASAGVMPDAANRGGSAAQDQDQSAEKSLIDAVYDALAASKRQGSDYVELSSLLPSARNSMGSLLSALQQLEAFGVIKRKDRNLIGLVN